MAQLSYRKRTLPNAGKHRVVLTRVEETDNKFYVPDKDPESKKSQLAWTFAYAEEPEMDVRVWSSPSLSSYKGQKSKALIITEALIEKELTEEEKESMSDTSELIGKECYVTVKHTKGEDGTTYAKVIDFESVSGTPF